RRRVVGIGVEMLVLDAAGLHRQKDEIALFPLPALAFDDRITLAGDDVDDESALMAVLAGFRPQLVREDDPLLQRRFRKDLMVEVIPDPALARKFDVALALADDDRAGRVALDALLVEAQHLIVRPLGF